MMKKFLDNLFPKSCVNCGAIGENYFCTSCEKFLSEMEHECYVCRESVMYKLIHLDCRPESKLNDVYYFYKYDELINKLMMDIKYGFEWDKTKEIVRLILKSEKFKEIDFSNIDLITYVPISKKRMHFRGFNQSEILAKELSKCLKIPYLKLLEKVKNTKPQIELSREERLKNLKDSFNLKKGLPVIIESQNILLIDDICTTGSTLENCALAVKKRFSHVKLYGLCFARGS
jgi:competence protein ComFC